MPGPDPRAQLVTVIAPGPSWGLPDPIELWQGRALLGVLARREVMIRYASAGLGVAWALVTPLALVAAFAIGFGAVAGIQAPGGTPYWLWAWAGILAWQTFAIPLTRGAASLVDNERLLGRVYLPRLALPLAAILAGLVDAAVSAAALLTTLVVTGHAPGWPVLLLPLAVLPALLLGTALGIALAALNARYRDLRHALPVLVQLLLLLCPIGYPAPGGDGLLQSVLALNPLAPGLELVRWSLLPDHPAPPFGALAASLACGVVLLLLGAIVFRHHERTIVDRI
jgi:lipopolysaccharide transport system permease protein